MDDEQSQKGAAAVMIKENYPSLYRCADQASLAAQRTYLRLQRGYLTSLVLGGALSASTVTGWQDAIAYIRIGLAVVVVVGFMGLWAMRARQDDKVWFDGRAVAESVKTATWRFMMKTQPFHDDRDAENVFIATLRDIREARPAIGKYLAAASSADGLAITPFMKETRQCSLEERRLLYAGSRVLEQKAWYAKRAKASAAEGTALFWTVLGLQVIIVTLAIVQAATAGAGGYVIAFVTTTAAVIATWSQIKRHEELAQSYAVAARELEEIHAAGDKQMDESEFAQFVALAEDAISREHTMWCARRDVRVPKVMGTR